MNSFTRFVPVAAACLGLACAAHNATAQIVAKQGVSPDSLPASVQKILREQEKKDAARGRTGASPTTEKAPSNETSAITTYEYEPDQIYPIRAGLGITNEVELSPNEKILDYSTGFSSGWELTRRDNLFYIKPKNVDVDTNMMIRTETHTYIFEMKVVATDWRTLQQARNAGVQYRISFTYPTDSVFALEAAKVNKEAEQSVALLKGRSYNFDYDYSTSNTASPWIIPINVYDDGRFTYIMMPDLTQFPTGNFPTIYMREFERSQDSLVNTTVEGNTIIVHGTYNYLALRHNDKIVALRRNTIKPSQQP